MTLSFDNAFDIENELPDALCAIAYLVEALPHYQKAVGINEKGYIDEKMKGEKK